MTEDDYGVAMAIRVVSNVLGKGIGNQFINGSENFYKTLHPETKRLIYSSSRTQYPKHAEHLLADPELRKTVLLQWVGV